ncbi:MAG: hypothetical protein F6J94_09440 [Moorea sp. SIO1F2]|uniref:hypothetical protein n=1 Tax=Moorena sp. SIO1F2 TaxID=2607819 RepID=UPI0013B8E5D8|nr:hypothetical protein [Moorena sp. SIO1F2]NET82149.1 hypothetical protein [Moorena sp. SIO1F2]
MEWASWWNGHLAVEWASCPFLRFGHLAVEWASCVELASCQFHAYFRAGRMPTLRIWER